MFSYFLDVVFTNINLLFVTNLLVYIPYSINLNTTKHLIKLCILIHILTHYFRLNNLIL